MTRSFILATVSPLAFCGKMAANLSAQSACLSMGGGGVTVLQQSTLSYSTYRTHPAPPPRAETPAPHRPHPTPTPRRDPSRVINMLAASGLSLGPEWRWGRGRGGGGGGGGCCSCPIHHTARLRGPPTARRSADPAPVVRNSKTVIERRIIMMDSSRRPALRWSEYSSTRNGEETTPFRKAS